MWACFFTFCSISKSCFSSVFVLGFLKSGSSNPPVSIIVKVLPFQIHSPKFLSRVVPGMGETMALREDERRLKRVDFPTLVRPIMATLVVSLFILEFFVLFNLLLKLAFGYFFNRCLYLGNVG